MTCKRDRNVVHPGILRRLRAAGCPLPSEDERNGITDLTIEVSRPELTRCYALRAGAEYVFGLRITNHTYGSLVLQRFAGRMDWPAALIFPVDPRIYMPETQVYRLESGRKFPCADVLNHRVGERGLWSRVKKWKAYCWPTAYATKFLSTISRVCQYLHGFRLSISMAGGILPLSRF